MDKERDHPRILPTGTMNSFRAKVTCLSDYSNFGECKRILFKTHRQLLSQICNPKEQKSANIPTSLFPLYLYHNTNVLQFPLLLHKGMTEIEISGRGGAIILFKFTVTICNHCWKLGCHSLITP